MGIFVEKRRKEGMVEVWLVNTSPHPESIHYEGETYVLGGRSEALIGTEPAPEAPTSEEPTSEEPTSEEPTSGSEQESRRRKSKR
ncbi:hypothetical protein MN1_870 [Thermus phage MN1]|nr:hypothetical protein MN1_870 [Thermus phage MN1]